MNRVEELKSEGQQFLDCGYRDLDDSAKLVANSYMRGLKDGKRLAENAQSEETEKT